MARNLTPLGQARVFRHPSTGELIVDTDSLRREGFSGDDFGYDDDFGEDDFDDDFGEDDLDEDDDFEGDDDFGEDLELGAGGRSRRRARRKSRKRRRLERRQGRIKRRLGKLGDDPAKPKKKKLTWGMTAVGGTDTLTEGGAATVKIRLQHHFRAQDLTFTGSGDGAKVTSIFFGDRVVWSNSDGIDVGVFASTGFLRGLLKGQSLRAGLDITVNGSLTGAGAFSVTLIGLKPTDPTC